MIVIQFLNNLTSFTLLGYPVFKKKMWAQGPHFKNQTKPNQTKPNYEQPWTFCDVPKPCYFNFQSFYKILLPCISFIIIAITAITSKT
jgi:hypothetical protein